MSSFMTRTMMSSGAEVKKRSLAPRGGFAFALPLADLSAAGALVLAFFLSGTEGGEGSVNTAQPSKRPQLVRNRLRPRKASRTITQECSGILGLPP